MVAEKAATGMFDAGLGQFGPHSRIIGPTGVESTYSYDRSGDIDELRIYDRALPDNNVALLANGETPRNIPAVTHSFANADTQKEWWFHYGWNRPGDIPAPLPARVLATANAAALKAPLDLLPKTEVVSLTLPPGANWKGKSVSVEIGGELPEITQMNNRVRF